MTNAQQDSERWLTDQLDRASALVSIPRRSSWRPARATHRRGGPLKALALATVAALAAVVLVARLDVGSPTDAQPLVSAPAQTSVPTSAPTVDRAIQLAPDAAWAQVRGALPVSIPVLRSTAFPARYDASSVTLEYLHDSSDGWRYRIGYHNSTGGNLLFALGAVNSGPPNQSVPAQVRGHSATLSTSNSWPAMQIFWNEGPLFYSIQSNDLTREEALQLAGALVEVRAP